MLALQYGNSNMTKLSKFKLKGIKVQTLLHMEGCKRSRKGNPHACSPSSKYKYLQLMTYPGVHGEKQPQLWQFSLDPLDLIRRERLGNGDLMEVLNFTEEAENWLWSFNKINEHRLKAVATEIVEGILWVILGEGTLGNSHYVHPPLLLVTDLIGMGQVHI